MRLALVVMASGLFMAPATSAQSDALDQAARAQLAAIPLTTSDLPEGYRLFGEAFLTAESASIPGVDATALTGAGFQGMYVSSYELQGGGGSIESYVSIWSDPAAAAAGFELLEDDPTTDPDATLTDEELDAGDGPAELSTGTREGDSGQLSVSDATFVVDRFVVGVAVETTPDHAVGGDVLDALVAAQESRATAVANGDAVAGADLALPAKVLDTRPLGVEIRAGFVTAAESEALYGVTGSSLGGVNASWVTLVGTGEGAAAPYVVVAVSKLETADNAARVVEQADALVPLSIELQPVDGFAVDGTEVARGFQYASGAAADGAPDSFRGVAQVGTQVIVIDVQGATSIDLAQQAVSDLMAAEVACLGGSCQLPDLALGS
jgi:hypothetical protein